MRMLISVELVCFDGDTRTSIRAFSFLSCAEVRLNTNINAPCDLIFLFPLAFPYPTSGRRNFALLSSY